MTDQCFDVLYRRRQVLLDLYLPPPPTSRPVITVAFGSGKTPLHKMLPGLYVPSGRSSSAAFPHTIQVFLPHEPLYRPACLAPCAGIPQCTTRADLFGRRIIKAAPRLLYLPGPKPLPGRADITVIITVINKLLFPIDVGLTSLVLLMLFKVWHVCLDAAVAAGQEILNRPVFAVARDGFSLFTCIGFMPVYKRCKPMRFVYIPGAVGLVSQFRWTAVPYKAASRSVVERYRLFSLSFPPPLSSLSAPSAPYGFPSTSSRRLSSST